MLINAAIDIGKIILSSEGRMAPQTYGQILSDLESLPTFTSLSGRLAKLAGLRDVLAHEYVDLRFGRIREFAEEGVGAIEELASFTEEWLDRTCS